MLDECGNRINETTKCLDIDSCTEEEKLYYGQPYKIFSCDEATPDYKECESESEQRCIDEETLGIYTTAFSNDECGACVVDNIETERVKCFCEDGECVEPEEDEVFIPNDDTGDFKNTTNNELTESKKQEEDNSQIDPRSEDESSDKKVSIDKDQEEIFEYRNLILIATGILALITVTGFLLKRSKKI